jgi:hypothetical protein
MKNVLFPTDFSDAADYAKKATRSTMFIAM